MIHIVHHSVKFCYKPSCGKPSYTIRDTTKTLTSISKSTYRLTKILKIATYRLARCYMSKDATWIIIDKRLPYGNQANGEPQPPPRIDLWNMRQALAVRLTQSLQRLPILGNLLSTFWYCVLAESDLRYGLESVFLNGGYRPSLWHAAHCLFHDQEKCPWAQTWIDPAPCSLAEARRRKYLPGQRKAPPLGEGSEAKR